MTTAIAGSDALDDNGKRCFPPRMVCGVQRRRLGRQTIVTVDGRVHLSLDEDESAVLDLLDGSRSLDDIAAESGADRTELIEELGLAGMLEGSEPFREPAVVLTRTGVEVAGFDRVIAATCRLGVASLVSLRGLVVLLVVAVVGLTTTVLAVSAGSRPAATPPASLTLLVLICSTLVAVVVHEAAHAVVIHQGGRRVGRAGIGFYWGSVSFYVDASDALFLGRRMRMAQAAAGPLADASLATLVVLVSLVLPASMAEMAVAVAVVLWLDVAINLLPFLRLDGYWLLCDACDTADLAERARGAVGDVVRGVRDRSTLALATYWAVSTTLGLALLTGTVLIWMHEFGPLVRDAWGESITGKAAAVAFCGPLLAALTSAVIATALRLAVGARRRATVGRSTRGGDQRCEP